MTVPFFSTTTARAVYRIFAKGGRTWSMSKIGVSRLFVAAGQPQGGGCIWKFKGGVNAPAPPKYTPDCISVVSVPRFSHTAKGFSDRCFPYIFVHARTVSFRPQLPYGCRHKFSWRHILAVSSFSGVKFSWVGSATKMKNLHERKIFPAKRSAYTVYGISDSQVVKKTYTVCKYMH